MMILTYIKTMDLRRQVAVGFWGRKKKHRRGAWTSTIEGTETITQSPPLASISFVSNAVSLVLRCCNPHPKPPETIPECIGTRELYRLRSAPSAGLMGNDDINIHKDHGFKKTSFQLQSLENFYSENKYPKQKVMENYAASLDLTYKQIRTWFVERRRKQKRENKDRSSSKKNIIGNDRARAPSRSALKCSGNNRNEDIALLADHRQVGRENKRRMPSKNKLPVRFQVLFSKDYILKKVFRKDGPPLGTEFDPLQANAFCRDAKSLQLWQDSQGIPKRRKVMESHYVKPVSPHVRNAPAKKYGIGKGLMTVWRATNLDSGKSPTGINCMDKSVAWMPVRSSAPPKETFCQASKRLQRVEPVPKHRSTQKKLEKRGPLSKKRKVPCKKDKNQNKRHPTECKLGVDKLNSLEQSNALMTLVDDEELELRELQATSNALRCSAHLTSSGRHGCPLCKDLLARFPPQIVKMKQPFSTRPWDSCPELVKKLFKIFQFLYSHGTAVEVSPFTLDDFAQTFHDKDSFLLGEIHVALLKMLLLDVERVITDGFNPRASKDCRFLGFLHFVKEQELNVNLWSQSLNPLTWTEILRQILIAAGFGSKNNTMRRELFSKERNHMVKYGLRPRTLKGELFSVLYEKGSSGLKVSELAKASQIIALDMPNTTEELEQLICSTLSSDITLFEKIAPAAYRLRVDPHIKGKDSQSDSDDSGSVDDDSMDSSESCSSDESVDSDELNSPISERRILKYKARHNKKGQLTQYTEIDESYTGEAWVLGLMEGEYSNLSIEEKLDALVALVDLAGTSCSLRMKEPVRAITAIFPDTQNHGSGAKIKKSAPNNHLVIKAREGPVPCVEETHLSPDSFPVISSEIFSMASKEHSSDGIKNTDAAEESDPNVHPLRSIYLGSDRRYNSYWLFLGPCNPNDPGHRRVYFESSEDGHWEVIDTAQAFRALLSVLDCRGSRESRLFASLETKEEVLCQAMDDYMTAETENRQRKGSDPSDIDHSSGDSSSPISDIDNIQISAELTNSLLSASGVIVLELGKNVEGKKQRWNRLQAFDKWIWNSFYSNLNAVKNNKRSFMESLARCESCHDLYWRDEKHCKICHSTFEVDFDLEERYTIHVATCRETEDSSEFPKHKVLPSQLQTLKAAIHAIELSLPDKALAEAWKRSGHKLWVKRLRRTSSLPELLQVLTDFVGAINEEWLNERAFALGCMALHEIVVYFQTMPQTTSAVALWMVRLDMLIAPHLERLLSERTLGSIPQSKRKRPCTKYF